MMAGGCDCGFSDGFDMTLFGVALNAALLL